MNILSGDKERVHRLRDDAGQVGRGEDAAAEHPDAAAQVLQPPVPVRRSGARSPLHHRPAQQLSQDGGAVQADAQAAVAGQKGPHLHPDGQDARYTRGLLLVQGSTVLQVTDGII